MTSPNTGGGQYGIEPYRKKPQIKRYYMSELN